MVTAIERFTTIDKSNLAVDYPVYFGELTPYFPRIVEGKRKNTIAQQIGHFALRTRKRTTRN